MTQKHLPPCQLKKYFSKIPGVQVSGIQIFSDKRGSSCELFRIDQDDTMPNKNIPVMSYLSFTKSGVLRGPHEHDRQTDCFVFVNGYFEVMLWDNRVEFPLETLEKYIVGANDPMRIVIPPKVVHSYRNIGLDTSFVINFPDELYAGFHYESEVDEIRHEKDGNPFYECAMKNYRK